MAKPYSQDLRDRLVLAGFIRSIPAQCGSQF